MVATVRIIGTLPIHMPLQPVAIPISNNQLLDLELEPPPQVVEIRTVVSQPRVEETGTADSQAGTLTEVNSNKVLPIRTSLRNQPVVVTIAPTDRLHRQTRTVATRFTVR